jgi:four helix bundle protein
MSIQSYRDLRVWQEGIQLTTSIYRLTDSFPPREQYGLISQLRRCAVSIPSNIAEGHARLSTREYLRQVSIALGSTAELETHLYIARELGYASADSIAEALVQADQLGKQLRSLTKSLKVRLDSRKPF